MYQWFVFTHLAGLVLFVLAHGASAFASFQIRTLRDPDVVAGYLTMSAQATRAAYIGCSSCSSAARVRLPSTGSGRNRGCGAR